MAIAAEMYTLQVYVPVNFILVNPVIEHRASRHRFAWKETRWVHIARCPCWRNPQR